MQDSTFGEVEFEQREVGDDGVATFKRRDDKPYRDFIQTLVEKGPGIEAKILVVTGPIKADGQTKQYKGRGKQELAEAKSFQEAANAMGHGLRVSARHQTDGKTLLRMMIVPKRQFTDQQVANRVFGQNVRRLDLAKVKLAKADGVLNEKPNDAEATLAKSEAQKTIKELEPYFQTHRKDEEGNVQTRKSTAPKQ